MTDTTTLAPTDEELEQLGRNSELYDDYAPDRSTFDFLSPVKFGRAVLAKWGAPAPASGEAAAIVTCDGVMGVAFTSVNNFGCDLPVGTKLYTAPPAQEARVPLTDSLAAEVVYSMGWELDDDEKDDMVRVVRATEGAHGITAAQKETP